MRRAWLGLIPLLALSCISVGPKSIPRDRTEYVESLRESWKRQVLLNTIGLRYAEAPIFLEVSSVINQYTLQASAAAGLGWGGLGGDDQSVGVSGTYADRPTITYTPMTGERYVRGMLTPIPPASIVGMVQAGWPVDFVFRLAVRSINGVSGMEGSKTMMDSDNGRAGYFAVLAALRRIQLSGSIAMRVEKREGGEAAVMFFSRNPPDAVRADLEVVHSTLGLEAGRDDYTIVFGGVAADGTEIALLTRSMIEVILELAAWAEVPPEDVAAGRTGAGRAAVDGETGAAWPLIRIRWSDDEPAGAFASVRYRDHWFYIEDTDFNSKRVFSFLMILLSLSESGASQHAPVVTVGAGG